MLPNIQNELEALQKQSRFRQVRCVETAQNPQIQIEGNQKHLFCSNNYLGLANHPALIEAAIHALQNYGSSSVASALISGYMIPHAELEANVASFLQTESAIAFPSGYMANLGVIPTLINHEDIIFSDRLNHRSIIDGCRLSRAQIAVYPHKDTTDLAKQLQKAQHHRRRLIVTDGVFSMDGDIAPLPQLVELAKQYNAILMVDDAHGTGVLGAHGRGTFEYFNLSSQDIDVHMTSGSKALGASGGFIAGNQALIDLIRNRSAAYIFTTSLAPDACASTTAAIDLISKSSEFRQRLWNNIQIVREGLSGLGLDLGQSQTQIIPIITGSDQTTVAISNKLYERGIFLYGIRPPTVPEGQCRLRLSIMATHTEEEITHLLDTLSSMKHKYFQ